MKNYLAIDNQHELRRIGAIGDIHAEDSLLQTALEFLDSSNLDLIVCVGDIIDGLGSVDRCCELLEKYRVDTVSGNHERWFFSGESTYIQNATPVDSISDRSRHFLSSLPKTQSYETVAGRLMLCHGIGECDMGAVSSDDDSNDETHEVYELWESTMALSKLIYQTDYRFIINGHTHFPMVKRCEDLTIINAGTLCRDRQPCCLIVDFEAEFVQYYNLDKAGPVSKRSRIQLFLSTLI
jgi:predicted phosphodiesterase